MSMKVDIHTHSVYSRDGLDSPKLLRKIAKRRGLDAIALTDHDTFEGLCKARKIDKDFFFKGIEIISRDGDILALGIDELVKKNMSAEETVERIKELGGIAIAPHPYMTLFKKGVGDLIKEIRFDAVEAFNAYDYFGRANEKAKKVCSRFRKPMVAGSDAHSAETVGYAYIEAKAENEEEFLKKISNGEIKIHCNLIPFPKILRELTRRFFIKPFRESCRLRD